MGCPVSQVRPGPPVLLVRLGPVAARLETLVRLDRLGLQGRLDLRDRLESDRKATPAQPASDLPDRLVRQARHSSEALVVQPEILDLLERLARPVRPVPARRAQLESLEQRSSEDRRVQLAAPAPLEPHFSVGHLDQQDLSAQQDRLVQLAPLVHQARELPAEPVQQDRRVHRERDPLEPRGK